MREDYNKTKVCGRIERLQMHKSGDCQVIFRCWGRDGGVCHCQLCQINDHHHGNSGPQHQYLCLNIPQLLFALNQ